ncbi:SAM-dependent methyltransferase [Pseudomonas sp. RIT-To-2]|uniref:SAM-dependent methyltransferase n=1 Tax=Pseudomonas sp. RIT-To-2 TaxID=3462541 RepID=UPI0024134F48
MSVADTEFDRLFANNDDPWAMRQRWYEQRKRALLLACLPRAEYQSIFEPGCANGETSAVLAQRCRRLLCSDTAERAVALTRQKLAAVPHASVEQGRLPGQWPKGPFDLVVINELGYYLDDADLTHLIEACRASLSDDGQVLACHWRTPIHGCSLDGDAVHHRLGIGLGMTSLLEHREADFVLQLWGRDPRSVAQHEGLR